jgi:hypothetical protein
VTHPDGPWQDIPEQSLRWTLERLRDWTARLHGVVEFQDQTLTPEERHDLERHGVTDESEHFIQQIGRHYAPSMVHRILTALETMTNECDKAANELREAGGRDWFEVRQFIISAGHMLRMAIDRGDELAPPSTPDPGSEPVLP